MTKIDIYSGFLGAGKTTLIKKMISECYCGEKLVLIENEFGEIGVDSGFLQDAGIEIKEMNSGCICCSLVGDFGEALSQVIGQYHPDRIIIEPSGVGKLSDVIAAVKQVTSGDVTLGHTVAVVDAGKVNVYMRNFGEFYNNQIESASTIILSRTDTVSQEKLNKAVSALREHNSHAVVVTTAWQDLTGMQMEEAMQGKTSISQALSQIEAEHRHAHGHCCHGHGEHHHEDGHCCRGHGEHHHEDGHCCHGHGEHHHEDGHCCHSHGEHHHEDGRCCHSHGEHHHEDGRCCHGHGEHHHEDGHCCHGEHDHHADEVFQSWGVETANQFTQTELKSILERLDSGEYGSILRAKGIVASSQGGWLHFDYVPEEIHIRQGGSAVTGRVCVIGAELQVSDIITLFGV